MGEAIIADEVACGEKRRRIRDDGGDGGGGFKESQKMSTVAFSQSIRSPPPPPQKRTKWQADAAATASSCGEVAVASQRNAMKGRGCSWRWAPRFWRKGKNENFLPNVWE